MRPEKTIFALLAFICVAFLAEASGAAERPQVAQAVVEQTNAYRAQLGVDAVARDPALDEAAQAFADWLAERGESMADWGHLADGSKPSDRAHAAGYAGCVGENLSYGKSSGALERVGPLATTSIEGWKNSPPHDANLRRARWRHIGVGVATGSAGGWRHFVVVQLFGDGSGATECFTVSH